MRTVKAAQLAGSRLTHRTRIKHRRRQQAIPKKGPIRRTKTSSMRLNLQRHRKLPRRRRMHAVWIARIPPLGWDRIWILRFLVLLRFLRCRDSLRTPRVRLRRLVRFHSTWMSRLFGTSSHDLALRPILHCIQIYQDAKLVYYMPIPVSPPAWRLL